LDERLLSSIVEKSLAMGARWVEKAR